MPSQWPTAVCSIVWKRETLGIKYCGTKADLHSGTIRLVLALYADSMGLQTVHFKTQARREGEWSRTLVKASTMNATSCRIWKTKHGSTFTVSIGNRNWATVNHFPWSDGASLPPWDQCRGRQNKTSCLELTFGFSSHCEHVLSKGAVYDFFYGAFIVNCQYNESGMPVLVKGYKWWILSQQWNQLVLDG